MFCLRLFAEFAWFFAKHEEIGNTCVHVEHREKRESYRNAGMSF